MKLFGIIGLILVQGSTLFQILHFYQNKKTNGVSIGFWWTVYIGLMCYLAYSISIMDWVYITSNCIGIVLSSISIIMYYYYRRGEEIEDGNRNIRLGLDCDVYSTRMGDALQSAKDRRTNAKTGRIFPEVPMCRGGDKNAGNGADNLLWEMQKAEMLKGLTANHYYILVCGCGKHATQFQGTIKYLSVELALKMIGAGAKVGRFQCYHCKKDAEHTQERRGGKCIEKS